MMKFTLLLILFYSFSLKSQYNLCGTPDQINPTKYLTKRASTFSGTIYINVFFHILKKTNGKSKFTTPNLNASINQLNRYYKSANIVFKLKAYDELRFNSYLTIKDTNHFHNLSTINNNSTALNIYIVNDITTYLGISRGSKTNSLVMQYDYLLTPITAHEVGHCLNLIHTFGNNSVADELANGTNCEISGDYICDTPPDPKGSVVNKETCKYIGGRGYNPLTNNIMSYSPPHCLTNFTKGQNNRMRMAIENSQILKNMTYSDISKLDNVCIYETKEIKLTGVNRDVTWSVSNNIEIISSNTYGVNISLLTTGSKGNGWVKATFGNGVVLTTNFTAGVPFSYVATGSISTVNYVNFQNKRWNIIVLQNVNHTNGWEWNITNSIIRDTESSRIYIYPNASKVIAKVRRSNECGSGSWLYKNFDIHDNYGGGGVPADPFDERNQIGFPRN